MDTQTNQALGMMGSAPEGRQSASGVLRERARRYRQQAEQLEALAEIASRLSGEAEAAMWELAIKA